MVGHGSGKVGRGRWNERFALSSGTVLGREHARLGLNNQDGVCTRYDQDLIVAVVTDGCSSGRFSEVGALMGATWLCNHIAKSWTTLAPDPSVETLSGAIQDLDDSLVTFLHAVLGGFAVGGDSDDRVLDFLLFTYLVSVVTPDKTWVFGMGDGVFAVNGAFVRLESGPGNAPDYPAYALVNPQRLVNNARTVPRLHLVLPTNEVAAVLIGTDGVGDLLRVDEMDGVFFPDRELDEILTHPKFERNPSLIQKRLRAIGERQARLDDDTTIVLIKRRAPLDECDEGDAEVER